MINTWVKTFQSLKLFTPAKNHLAKSGKFWHRAKNRSLSLLMSVQLLQEYTPSPLRAQLSSIAGSISFSCWLVLTIPQLVEMWRVKSVDGISPLFLICWTVGDLANVIGAFWGHLLPEVIITGVWFLFADNITLACYYYLKRIYPDHRQKRLAAKTNALSVEAAVTEAGAHEASSTTQASSTTPLIEPQHTRSHSTQLKRHLSHRRHSSTVDDVFLEPSRHSLFVRFGLPLIFVIGAGLIGSLFSPNGAAKNNDDSDTKPADTGPVICGYISAVLYLTARLPQIYHNHKHRSCEGLSLLFFLYSTLANLCYGLQIVLFRNDREYLTLNAPWILGSVGTIFEDLIIYFQFYKYGELNKEKAQQEAITEFRREQEAGQY